MRRLPVVALLLALPVPAAAQDAAAGTASFKARCQMCHGLTPGKAGPLGPSLAGVVGRKAASTAFAYSSALKASGLTWTPANLDRFLTAPQKLVPGTRMVVAVSDPRQRADLIAALAAAK